MTMQNNSGIPPTQEQIAIAESLGTEAPEAEQTATVAPAVDERLAKAYEIEAKMARGDEEPEEDLAEDRTSEEAEEPADPEPSPDPEPTAGAPRTLSELRAISEQKRKDREAREAESAKANEIAELRAEIAALKSSRPQSAPAGLDPEALKRDPMGALQAAGLNPNDVLESLTKARLHPGAFDVERALAPKIDNLAKKVEAIESAKNAAATQKHEDFVESTKSQFGKLTRDVTRFPHFARLPEKRRISWGWDIAVEADKAGEPMTDVEIAQAIERELAGEAPPTPDRGGNDAAEGGETKHKAKARKGSPKSLTNDLASPNASPKPMTEADRLEAARRLWMSS